MDERDNKGKFIKGHSVSKDIREKLRIFNLGKKHTPDCKHCESVRNNTPWNKGIKIDKTKYPNIGHLRPHTEEARKKMSLAQSGEKSVSWKGGISVGKNAKDYQRRRCLHRWALKKNSGGNHTHFQWNDLKKKYNYMCLCCKKSEPEIKLEEDHIIPLSKGGSDDISNIQPLCKRCNVQKYTKTISYISLFELNEK